MGKVKLTETQLRPLRWLAEQDGRELYGPMPTGMGGCRNFGCAGGGLQGPILLSTGYKLLKVGAIEHVSDKYPLGYYALTDLGRSALADEGKGK